LCFQELAEARRIFERVENRDLYKCIDYKVFNYSDKKTLDEFITPEAIVQRAKALPPGVITKAEQRDDNDIEWSDSEEDEGGQTAAALDVDPVLQAELTAEQVIVTMSTMHYGMKEKNPLDFVQFYTKNKRNRMCPRLGDTMRKLNHFHRVFQAETRRPVDTNASSVC